MLDEINYSIQEITPENLNRYLIFMCEKSVKTLSRDFFKRVWWQKIIDSLSEDKEIKIYNISHSENKLKNFLTNMKSSDKIKSKLRDMCESVEFFIDYKNIKLSLNSVEGFKHLLCVKGEDCKMAQMKNSIKN